MSSCWEAEKDAKTLETTENLRVTDPESKTDREQPVLQLERLPN